MEEDNTHYSTTTIIIWTLGYVALEYDLTTYLINESDVLWTQGVITITLCMMFMLLGVVDSNLIHWYENGSIESVLWSSASNWIYKCKVCEIDIIL